MKHTTMSGKGWMSALSMLVLLLSSEVSADINYTIHQDIYSNRSITTYIQGQYVSIGNVLNLTNDCRFGVYAVDISTGTCEPFNSTCEIPNDWVRVDRCSYSCQTIINITNETQCNQTEESGKTADLNCSSEESDADSSALPWQIVCLMLTISLIAMAIMGKWREDKIRKEKEE